MATSYLQPIDPRLLEVIDFFNTRLVGVPFPGLDGATLDDATAAVHAAAAEAKQLDEAAERAYRVLDEQQAALMARLEHTLRYARIYAADQPALLREIEALRLPGSSQLPTLVEVPAKKERKKKSA
ncbi:MAG TPA: hypothetical protein VGF99_04180 [Myxococcota bacterium]